MLEQKELHSLKVVGSSSNPEDVEIFLDGRRLGMVTKFRLNIDPGSCLSVQLDLALSSLELDLPGLIPALIPATDF